MLNKKISLGATMAVAAVVAAVTVSVTYVYAMDSFNTKVADVNARQAMYTKLSEIDQKARQDYIGVIDEKKLTDGICAGYIGGLGNAPAKYLSAEKYKDYVSAGGAKTIGVGVRTFQDNDGNMEVMEVIPGAPAEKAGVKKGDVIIAMDDKEIVRITYGDALNKLDGAVGTTVKLTVLRPAPAPDPAAPEATDEAVATGQTLSFSIARAEYTRRSIVSSVINGNVGYMRISQFSDSTPQLFNTELSSLMNQSVGGIVLDLRNNSGGSVEAAAAVLDVLLAAGNTVSMQDKSGAITVEYTSKSNEATIPVTVLVNAGTYGAAEIFAADVQDYKKGAVVGDRTAGSGTKDEVIPLSDGSAIMISVANYLRINGVPFNGVGITPDIPKSLTEEQVALLARLQLPTADDPQVQAAVSALMRQGVAVAEPPGVTVAPGEGTDAIPPTSSAAQ